MKCISTHRGRAQHEHRVTW